MIRRPPRAAHSQRSHESFVFQHIVESLGESVKEKKSLTKVIQWCGLSSAEDEAKK